MADAATSFEQQHEKNMHILGLIRDEPAWALSRILRAEELLEEARQSLIEHAVQLPLARREHGPVLVKIDAFTGRNRRPV